MALIVQKFGGATVSDPEEIKSVAQRIFNQYQNGDQLVIVVSAMGKTTNQLIELAQQVSQHPRRRELDMLLSTGERISMSLLSMALNDLGCPAISFTGSQAGVFTDESHQNAFIKDVRPIRVEEALKKNHVVVLAGFQGVSPESKEITTLGRGGSDTTAVAMAAALKADRCEILKDVPAVFSADPNLIKDARPLHQLTYSQLLEMTFWGAKVLHYRSVELGLKQAVPLYIGPAHSFAEGTFVMQSKTQFESTEILSLNSHELVLKIIGKGQVSDGLKRFQDLCVKNEIAFPQLLWTQSKENQYEFYLTGPSEILNSISQNFKNQNEFDLSQEKLSTVTATCSGSTTPEVASEIAATLEANGIKPINIYLSALSTTILVQNQQRQKSIELIHKLIGKNYSR